MSVATFLILLGIGLAAGMLAGVVGVGGGIIIVPALVYFLGLGQHMAQGTSILLMLPPIGVLAAWNYYKDGSYNLAYAAVIAIFFIIGGYFGSRWALKVDAALLRKLFGGFMILVALKLIFGK